jgi:L-lactate dehydrogenase complex protein LldE
VFDKPYPVVVPSGSCAGMMKHHYPTLFAGTPMKPLRTPFFRTGL